MRYAAVVSRAVKRRHQEDRALETAAMVRIMSDFGHCPCECCWPFACQGQGPYRHRDQSMMRTRTCASPITMRSAMPTNRTWSTTPGIVSSVRVIAGSFGGVEGPVPPRPAQPCYFDVDLPARTSVSIPIADGHTALVHGVTGALLVGREAKPIAARQCAVLSRDGDVVVATGSEAGRALLLAGKPFGETIVHYGPFVMNTHA